MKSLVLGVALSLAVALAGCANVNRAPSNYNASVRRNFLSGCEQQSQRDGLQSPAQLCTCAYDKLRSSLPSGEFRNLNEQLTDRPATLPAAVRLLIRDCER